MLPINFAILGGNKAAEHLLDTGDVIAVTIQGVIPEDTKELPPIINGTQMTLNAVYYPPLGAVNAPNIGLPLSVQSNGNIQLPLVDQIQARGLTLIELSEKIRKAYLDKEIIKEENAQVNVTWLAAA